MTQTQFLLVLISIIPFVNCLIIQICSDSPKLVNIINRTFPILFLVNLIGIYGDAKHYNSYLVLVEATRGVSLGFALDQVAIGFLFLLGFFWLIFIFYSQRFLQLTEARNVNNFKIFFTLIVGFVNLIIISKNLLSILFFYNCLVLICHFFALKFLHKKSTKFSHIFTSILYLESISLFLAIVATYKFTGQIDFADGGVISEKLNSAKYAMLLILYLSGLFLSVLLPSYLLHRNANFDPPIIYSLFFLAYGLSSFYIFVKLLAFIFGFESFALVVSKIGFAFFEWIFLANIATASFFLIRSNGLKSSFFYLFFQQFLFTLFLIITFATFDKSAVSLALISFLFSFTLVFLSLSNFILYLNKAEGKGLDGLFYDLRITSILLIFGIVSLAGIAPSLSGVSTFFLLKIIFKKKLFLTGIIFIVNFASLTFFAWKAIYPLFFKLEKPRSQTDLELAKNIDFDSSLILTSLVVGIAMFLSLILFQFVINFFSL